MEPLNFYNALTRKIETFQPLEPGKVKMYHCGPTVYQRPHIGNYRAFLLGDLLRRVLEACGYETLQVMNLTDVGHLVDDAEEGEDKLEREAAKEQVDPWKLVEQVSRVFFQDLARLRVRPAHHYPRATDHIPEMVSMIQELIRRGHAYAVGENVYFDVASFPAYGALSGNKVEELEAGARLEVNPEKRHPADFALWKSDPRHLMKWETEFGPHGFPGWHIECSAMAMKYLGEQFDIHTGGEDNVFPHHECEIAQSESATGKTFVNLWMHTKFLQVDGGKMSKSLGNVYNLDDLQDRGFSALDYRFFVLRAHYRGTVNFTWEALRGAAEARRTLRDFVMRLQAELRSKRNLEARAGEHSERARREFWRNLADDLNTSAALAPLFELRNHYCRYGLEAAEAADALQLMQSADEMFEFVAEPEAEAVGPAGETCQPARASDAGLSDDQIDQLVNERLEHRRAKNFARSDEIRDQLSEAGIVLEDGPEGTSWYRS